MVHSDQLTVQLVADSLSSSSSRVTGVFLLLVGDTSSGAAACSQHDLEWTRCSVPARLGVVVVVLLLAVSRETCGDKTCTRYYRILPPFLLETTLFLQKCQHVELLRRI